MTTFVDYTDVEERLHCVEPINRRPVPPADYLQHPRFYTKAGLMRPYALACGYVEDCTFIRADNLFGPSLYVRLRSPAGTGQYVVALRSGQYFENVISALSKIHDGPLEGWFDSLVEARKYRNKLVDNTIIAIAIAALNGV